MVGVSHMTYPNNGIINKMSRTDVQKVLKMCLIRLVDFSHYCSSSWCLVERIRSWVSPEDEASTNACWVMSILNSRCFTKQNTVFSTVCENNNVRIEGEWMDGGIIRYTE